MSDDSEKARLNIRVDAEVWDEFQTWVEDKHGKRNVVVGMELEDAMKRHMRVSEFDRLYSELELIRADIDGLRSELEG